MRVKWPEIKETLAKRYNNAIKRLTQTHSEDVFQLYMNAFARQIDPHTSYLSPRNAEQFQSEMNLSLEGIGAVLQMTNDYTVIRSLVAVVRLRTANSWARVTALLVWAKTVKILSMSLAGVWTMLYS